jgi:hypothetical protein
LLLLLLLLLLNVCDLIYPETYPRVSQQALNRWGVAYTLINNPKLVKYTASKLALKKQLTKVGKRHLLLGDHASESSSVATRPSSIPSDPSPIPPQPSCDQDMVRKQAENLESYGASVELFKRSSAAAAGGDP